MEMCLRGNFNIIDLVWMRYTISNITNTSSNAPIRNSQALNSTRSLVSIVCSYNATITFPRIDIVVPTTLCTRFKLNISVLNRLVTISYLNLKPKANCTSTQTQRIQASTKAANGMPVNLLPSTKL